MVQLTINRQWLVMSWHWSATSHYLIYVIRLQWIKMCTFCTEAYDAICYSQQPASTASTNVLFSLEISPGYRLTINMHRSARHNTSDIQTVRDFSHFGSSSTYRDYGIVPAFLAYVYGSPSMSHRRSWICIKLKYRYDVNTFRPKKMAPILQTTFWSSFSAITIVVFRFKIPMVHLVISQHWFR